MGGELNCTLKDWDSVAVHYAFAFPDVYEVGMSHLGSRILYDIVNRREGQYRVRIMKNHNGFDCAYPGVIIMPDGTIVATTYGHWTEGEKPYVVTVHVHPDELDAIYNSIKQ